MAKYIKCDKYMQTYLNVSKNQFIVANKVKMEMVNQ